MHAAAHPTQASPFPGDAVTLQEAPGDARSPESPCPRHSRLPIPPRPPTAPSPPVLIDPDLFPPAGRRAQPVPREEDSAGGGEAETIASRLAGVTVRAHSRIPLLATCLRPRITRLAHRLRPRVARVTWPLTQGAKSLLTTPPSRPARSPGPGTSGVGGPGLGGGSRAGFAAARVARRWIPRGRRALRAVADRAGCRIRSDSEAVRWVRRQGAGARERALGLWHAGFARALVVFAGVAVPPPPRSRRGGRRRGDAGMSTAEYAVGTIAACGFAALLFKILTSPEVRKMLSDLIRRALSLAG
ncbi:DUF4244 domain-containing protein [Bailinhaonella thermotolerans]|uniref:DUF4244 domain-containing protein n=1 Tax=Bailinhaonella thermotolerans TaxID=1070861 RepID=A0A3A4AI79_9ACTN|nr:DUF4244 domain-containing protein [Bailinhaonella thermotolerans]